MYIKFRSSGFSKGRGFSLTYITGSYKSTNKANIMIYIKVLLKIILIGFSDCHVNLKGYQGAIEMVKEEYSNEDTCVWTIVAPKRSKINITFTSFKILHSIIMVPIHQGDDSESLTSSLPFNRLKRYFQPLDPFR